MTQGIKESLSHAREDRNLIKFLTHPAVRRQIEYCTEHVRRSREGLLVRVITSIPRLLH